MSRENVEIVREAGRLYEAADWDGFGALSTERAGVWPPDGWPEPGPHFGRVAVVQEFRRIHEPWETNRVVVGDPTGRDDRLVVQVRWSVEGESSGAPVETTMFVAVLFENGQIAEWRSYWNRAEALEAAGLSE